MPTHPQKRPHPQWELGYAVPCLREGAAPIAGQEALPGPSGQSSGPGGELSYSPRLPCLTAMTESWSHHSGPSLGAQRPHPQGTGWLNWVQLERAHLSARADPEAPTPVYCGSPGLGPRPAAPTAPRGLPRAGPEAGSTHGPMGTPQVHTPSRTISDGTPKASGPHAVPATLEAAVGAIPGQQGRWQAP